MAKRKKVQKKSEIAGKPEAVEPPVEPVGEPEIEAPIEPSIPSETAVPKVVVRNILRQTIDVRLRSGTITISPRGKVEITEEDLLSSHLRNLEREGFITIYR